MISFTDIHDQLSNDHFGFRKAKTTTDALCPLSIWLWKYRNRQHTVDVCLNLAKVFDCIAHKTLLDKLNSHGAR